MSLTQEENIAMRIAELEQSLLSQHPMMPQYLKQIHRELSTHPELVHLMTNDQRSILIAALEKQTGISVFAALKAKKPSARSMATATLSDFGI